MGQSKLTAFKEGLDSHKTEKKTSVVQSLFIRLPSTASFASVAFFAVVLGP